MPRLDVIGVIVSDMERAIHFCERLGLRFPEDPDPEGHGHVETTLPEGLRFTLDAEESVRSFDPDWTPPSAGQRMAIAFRCESPTDIASSPRMTAAAHRRWTSFVADCSGLPSS